MPELTMKLLMIQEYIFERSDRVSETWVAFVFWNKQLCTLTVVRAPNVHRHWMDVAENSVTHHKCWCNGGSDSDAHVGCYIPRLSGDYSHLASIIGHVCTRERRLTGMLKGCPGVMRSWPKRKPKEANDGKAIFQET